MKFNTKKRHYVDDRGRVIPAKEIRKHVNDWIEAEREEVVKEAEKVAVGTLAVSAFFSFMRDKIQNWHEVAGVVAYGGEAQMDEERWARIEEKVQSELNYLDGFEQDASLMNSISGRAAQYIDSAYSTYANSELWRERDEGVDQARRSSEDDPSSCDECVAAASTDWQPIDEVPDIGSLTCLNNCRCVIEYNVGRNDVALPAGVSSLSQSEMVQ